MPRNSSRISRNDYSYLLKERSSPVTNAHHTPPPPAGHTGVLDRPHSGQPLPFRDGVAHGSGRAHDTMSTSAFSLHTPGTRQSQISVPGEYFTVGRAHTSTHQQQQQQQQQPSPSQLPATLLKRAGSAAPYRPTRERTGGSGHSISSAQSASRWFRRGRNRSASKQKEPAASGYQLDMNFSDVGNFVDLAKVRRPSMTSSLGTGESSLNASNATGDSSKEDAAGHHLAPPDGASVASAAAADPRRPHGSPASGIRRRSQATITSPLLKEAGVADARSVASSMKRSAQRMSSAGSALNSITTPSQKSEMHLWPSDYSWQHRDSSVKSRRPTTLSTDGDSEFEYIESANDHGSVQSAPMFESKHQLAHFTDPWASDRKQQLALHASGADHPAPGAATRLNASAGSLRGRADSTTGPGGARGEPRSRGPSAIPKIEYPPRKSEPWAPPESWAVLPTTHEGAEEAGGAAGLPKELVSDGECASSDSEIEDDNKMYSMRIYKEDSTFGTFHCRLSTTTADFMHMAAKKFFIHDITRYCLYMQKANGLDRTLNSGERPANILKNYLEQMGYRPEDNITLQGREDNSYLCKFSLFKAAIPRVSPDMEVEVTSFQHVDLRARKLQAVPVFLYAQANKIVSLNMSKNPGLNFPADFVQLCGNMRELRLSTCQFSRFPASIQHFPHLTFLDLSGNDINRVHSAPLDRLSQLKTLMLRNNRLVDLPDSLARLCSLRVLNVSNNNLSTFPLVVTRINSLEELDISFNRIPTIPDAIESLVNLVRLNVMGNALTGGLPAGLGQLSKLEELDVRQNRLQDFGVLSKLAGLKLLYTESNMATRARMNLACAVSVSLRANKLTQCHLTNPARTLVFLDLSRNQLTELPSDTFMDLPNLEHLVLDSNHIVSIPPSVGNLQNLTCLSCANNILSLIPIELARLEKLVTLDLHSNNLKLLPPEIWLMPRLAVLNLSSNLLEQFPHPSMLENLRRQQGGSSSVRAVAAAAAAAAQRAGAKVPVPNRVTQTMQMAMTGSRQPSPLSISAIEANGEVLEPRTEISPAGSRPRMKSSDSGRVAALAPPVPLKRYSVSDPPPLSLSLRELRMGDNNLDDEVFTLMAFLPELRILNLSYNELYDLQPSAMVHMRKVTELYLSGTQISTIPEEEPNAVFWRSLRLLNINGNKLQTLPSWLAKIHGLTVLDVGSNVLKYNITNWPYDWNWNWNTGLKYLNFSYNERFEIKDAHLRTKAFHNHEKLAGSEQESGPGRDLFNYITKEPPKSDCVSDFYQLTDMRILGLVQLTIMVSLPDETPNRRVRTTDAIKQVKYGIADSLGNEDRVSAWDLASSRFRMADNECLFGLFHARETGTSSSAISKYLKENFLYVFRDELDKVSDQAPGGEGGARASQYRGGDASSEHAVTFAESSPASGEDGHDVASQLSDNQLHAALRRTFLTLNKDLGTHNRQLTAAAAAAEAFTARAARPSTTSTTGNAASTDGQGPLGSKITECTSGEAQGGSTAVVAYIHGRTLHVANVGDALGVVSRRGTPMVLSTRHDPYDPSEVRRIRSIGGYITQQGKVQGQTDVTRAFGYFHLLPYVNADPTINSLDLTEEDEFLIMANRPVWDAITPQIAVDIARKHRRDPRLAAARVRDHVLAYSATKSVMVMVIGFGPMFAKNNGRPMRGFSVRDSVYPSVSDHRARYAMSRRMSRSPSAVLPPALGPRPSVSHPISADGKPGIPGMHPIPGAQHAGAAVPALPNPYDTIDEFDEFSSMPLNRTRRQRDRDVSARPGDSTLARLEREVPPPIGEVVLVFTDVKNSTVQWETNPVAMRSAIKVHNGIMRRMLRSIGGYEVKTEGDAFMVSFPTVASALHWCLAVQVTFLTADWPQEIVDSPHGCPIHWPPEDGQGGGDRRESSALGEEEGRLTIYRGLRVRMGMHFGSPVSEEDPITRRMDYFGPMVNRAARISGAADGGQVYVSQDVMDEVFAILELFDTADHNGIADMRQIIDEPSLARDVQALRNLGLCAVQIGEIKLKGLESPEFVSHVYPAALRGRIDMQTLEDEQLRQQQKQKHRKKKQDWVPRDSATGGAQLAKQRGNKASKSTESLSQSMASEYGGQRSSLDEGSLQAYSESASPRVLSALSSPRGSISRKASATSAQQRGVRELPVDLAPGAAGDGYSAARYTGGAPIWSAPNTRRSISLMYNYAGRSEQLGSIGEDSSSSGLQRPQEGWPHGLGRAAKEYSGMRMPPGAAGPPNPRQSFYLPPPHYSLAQGPLGEPPSWSRQGSGTYLSGLALPGGYLWQLPGAKSRRVSGGSVDMAVAVRGANSIPGASTSGQGSLEASVVDPLQLDTLHRLVYRLQILAVEPDTGAVRPSFDYFVALQADSLASYCIHRASTVSASVSSAPDQPLPPLPRARPAPQQPHQAPRSLQAGSLDADAQCSSASSIDEILDEYQGSGTPEAMRAKCAVVSVQSPTPGSATAVAPQVRPVSPVLAQPIPIHRPLVHRHTQSASPGPRLALQWASAPAAHASELSSRGTRETVRAPLALNEPPVPLYLFEGMTQQHLVAALAMLTRDLECTVCALEARMGDSSDAAVATAAAAAATRPGKRNDSKFCEDLGADGALREALGRVAEGSRQSQLQREFAWTEEHVLRALDAYSPGAGWQLEGQ
ncbi:cysteinyl-tRNA synthetase [Coemansia biformis]|uniref:Adenylate cyclase n=1 Tax=Coemansia biformis TaxID=1286918 RepID=A0A9W7YJC9_9FUNG|nr:cysteinyl-tRNA synthetase [Coemansia biformis]